MEFEIIENELSALEREIKELLKLGHGKELRISGKLSDVAEYISALNNLKGHVELTKMAIAKMKGEDV